MSTDKHRVDLAINSIVADMYRFIDEHPEWYPDGKIPPESHTEDAVMVINKKSGCYSTPEKIIHTDLCSCSDDYDNYSQDKENWL